MPRHSRLDARIALMMMALVALLATSACDSPILAKAVKPTLVVTPSPTTVEIEVFQDRLEPEQVSPVAGTPLRLRVVNRSQSPCAFFAGDYLQDVQVAAGGSAEMSFTIPSLPGPAGAETSLTTMGCRGDQARTGRVVVQPQPGPEPQPKVPPRP